VPWETLKGDLVANWKAGQCVTIVGPRGSGKTHLALELLDISPHVIVLATKRQDPLLQDLRSHGYIVTGDLSQVLWTHDEKRGRGVPVHRKVVYWPQFSEDMSEHQRISAQSHAMSEALGWIDKTGGWTVLVDETMWMAETLRLEKQIKSAYFQGRTQGVSIIALAQRPTNVPRLAFSSADYLFLSKTGDKRDIDNLREISSAIPKETIIQALQELDKPAHEFLFIDANNDRLAKVIAPAR
jgi:ABC-type cobalamin/Fe3+-siderophores transport system ATPase subunit